MTFSYLLIRRRARSALAAALLFNSGATIGAAAGSHPSFAGTWTLVAADKELPDGTRTHEYGEHPKGRLMIDAMGRYSLQIFQPERPNFATDEAEPSPAEYRSAVEGASTHYGHISVDWTHHTLRFAPEEALYPNLRGTVQNRRFEFSGGVLSYRIPRTPEGIVRISAWRRE